MKEKLTKNDSMSVKKTSYDLKRIKKSERIRIAAAYFEAMLGKKGLWREYYSNLDQSVVKETRDTVYTDWMEWAYKTPLHKWISSAFSWEKTPQGVNIWGKMDYEWLKILCYILNI